MVSRSPKQHASVKRASCEEEEEEEDEEEDLFDL